MVVRQVGVTEALVVFVIATPAEDVLMFPLTPFGKNPPAVALVAPPINDIQNLSRRSGLHQPIAVYRKVILS